MLVTLLGVSVIIFFVLRLLPGNAITASLGVSAGLLSHAQLAALDHYYGIGKPLLQQFFSWLGVDAQRQPRRLALVPDPVASLIGSRLPVTLELAIASLIIGELIGVVFGVFGALRPGQARSTTSARPSRSSGLGVPSFVLGTGLVTFLSSVFQYFPSSEGYASLFQDPWLNLQQIFFPALDPQPRHRGGDHADDARRHARGERA